MPTARKRVRRVVETADGQKYRLRTYKVINRARRVVSESAYRKQTCASKAAISSLVKTEFKQRID